MGSKKFILLLALTILVFAGLVTYGDGREIARSLATFPVEFMLLALALAGFNYLLRFLRWVYYLKVLGIKVTLGASSLIFLSGLAMSITPGKMGELVKSYLLRERTGVPISQSAPVVLMERLTDVVSVILLGLTGLLLLPLPVTAVLLVVLALCGVMALLFTSRHSDRVARLPVLRKWESALLASRDGLRLLMTPQALALATLLGTLAWLSEGIALWVIMEGLGAPMDLLRALPIYAAATLVGAVSALPGGLLGTEVSMVALLQQAGAGSAEAATGTLLVRLATLWFAVAVGLAALLALHRFFPARAKIVEREASLLSQEQANGD